MDTLQSLCLPTPFPQPSSWNNPSSLGLQNKLSNIITRNIASKYSLHNAEKGQIFLPGDPIYLP